MSYTRIVENVILNETLVLDGPEWDNTLIRNVIIENVTGNGIMLRDVDNVLIENVTIRNVSGDGIKLSTLGSTSDVTIRNSTIQRIGEDGINAGQRKDAGVDHPGLQILGNTIEQTGLNGGTTGLMHGIYVQSTDFLIQGNRILDSTDGNGISVRSSGQVLDNYIETSRESGIAYYADHANGPSDHLRIEGNVILDTGNGTTRTDINLLNVPSGREGEVVGTFTIRNNILTQTDRPAISVDQDYVRIGSIVEMDGNSVVSEVVARAHDTPYSGETPPLPGPDASPQAPEIPDDAEGSAIGLVFEATGLGRTEIDLSTDGTTVDTLSVSADTSVATASLTRLGLELRAEDGSYGARIGVDDGRLFVASGGDVGTGTISGNETLIVGLTSVSDRPMGYATVGLIDAAPEETVLVELFREGKFVGAWEHRGTDHIDSGNGIAFDEIQISAGWNSDFAVDSLVFFDAEAPDFGPIRTMGLDLTARSGNRTEVTFEVDGEPSSNLIVQSATFLPVVTLDALSVLLSVEGQGTRGVVVDNGRLGIMSTGENLRSASQISGSEELVFTVTDADALAIDIDLRDVGTTEIVLVEAFRDGRFVGADSFRGASGIRFDSDIPFDEIRLSADAKSSFSLSGFEVTQIDQYDPGLV